MTTQYYFGQGNKRKEGASGLPKPRRSDFIKPENYLAGSGLVDAANVAIMLGQPLLITGEAGTGKTQFAYSLAWELGLGEPLKFETKSTSVARDLFYTYDAFKRFQDLQSGLNPESILPYISYQALGIAILFTREWRENTNIVSSDFSKPKQPIRSVVLIDEIDKAPRDFPNDILNEIENMYFRIPEMGNQLVEANSNLPPIVIVTSNSEKDLPDAFLRRCIYYNIPFPDTDRLRKIITNHLGAYLKGTSPFVDDALDLFFSIRNVSGGLRKPPSISEILGWIMVLRDMKPNSRNPLRDDEELASHTLSNLIKNTDDLEKANKVVEEWLKKEHQAA